MNTERRCLHPQDLDVPHKRLKTHQRLDLGTETESEKLLQEMLYRQLDTNFSIKQLAKQHKSFTPAGNYVQLPVAGTCSLNEYISIGSHESQKQRLLQCGLTTEEVQLYLEHQGSLVNIATPFSCTVSCNSFTVEFLAFSFRCLVRCTH